MKKIFLILIFLFSLTLVYSQDIYYINPSETIEINEWEICHEVTNNGFFRLMVPTNSSLEWADFIEDSPNFVEFSDCGKNNFGDGSDGNIWVKTDGIWQDLGSGYIKLYGDTQWPSIEDGDMVVINARNFQVDNGVTFTTTNRCRGLMIYTTGNMTIDGTISMTARGAHANPADSIITGNTPVAPSDGNSVPSEGLVIRRYKNDWSDVTSEIINNAHASLVSDFQGSHNSNDLFYGTGFNGVLSESNQEDVENGLVIKIPRVGGTGGPVNQNWAGLSGGSKLFSTGGGGSGGQGPENNPWRSSGSGGSGTCFSGGSGTGGADDGVSTNANNYGGPATVGGGRNGAAGAAGNPGSYGNSPGYALGDDGTGGLLILNVRENLFLSSLGILESNGSSGGSNGAVAGGSSGGGIIMVLYAGSLINQGQINVNGGVSRTATVPGGSGGQGSIIGPLKIQSGPDTCDYGQRRISGVCQEIRKSCKEILDNGESNEDGQYYIDPDGFGGDAPRNVYCDMTTDGGGWTLVVGIDGTNHNHVTENDYNSNLLINVDGKGKFSDEIINKIRIAGNGKLLLYCNGVKTYFGSNCDFGATDRTYDNLDCTNASKTINGPYIQKSVVGPAHSGVQGSSVWLNSYQHYGDYGTLNDNIWYNGCFDRNWGKDGSLWVR